MLPSDLMTISIINLEPGVGLDVQKQILGNIETIISISEPPAGVSVTVSGNPAFSKEMGEAMGGAEMGTLILVAMVFMTIAVMLLFSHVRYRLLPIGGVVTVGLILTFGLMGLFGIPVSMVVVAAFPVLIGGVGIDYAIQFHARFDEEARHSPPPKGRMDHHHADGGAGDPDRNDGDGPRVHRDVLCPGADDSRLREGLRHRSCLLLRCGARHHPGLRTHHELPAEERDADGQPRPRGGTGHSLVERYEHLIGKMAHTVAKHPLPVLLIFGVVAVGGYYLDEKVPISADEKTFVPDTMPALQDMEKITRTMGSTTSVPIIVAGDDVLSLEMLEWIDRFGTYELEHNDKMTGVTSVATLIRDYNGGVLPATSAEVDAVVARIPEATLKGYLNGRMETALKFSTVAMEMDAQKSFIEGGIRSDIAWNDPPLPARR